MCVVLMWQALCCFRIAAIRYGVYARGLAGNAGSTNVRAAVGDWARVCVADITLGTQAILSGKLANNSVDMGLQLLEALPRTKL